MTLFAVSVGNLVEVGIAAGISGVLVTGIFSLAVLGTARSIEARREHRSAWAWTLLAVAGVIGVLLASAAGVYAVAAH